MWNFFIDLKKLILTASVTGRGAYGHYHSWNAKVQTNLLYSKKRITLSNFVRKFAPSVQTDHNFIVPIAMLTLISL